MDLVTALFCVTMTTRSVVIQNKPQKVEEVTNYQACTSDTEFIAQTVKYFRVDGKMVKPGDPDILYKLEIGPH